MSLSEKEERRRDRAALRYMEQFHILKMEDITPLHRIALYAILDGNG